MKAPSPIRSSLLALLLMSLLAGCMVDAPARGSDLRSAWRSSCFIRVTLTLEVPTQNDTTFGCWSGSGTLLDPLSGLILTNFHVADASQKVVARSYAIYFPWRERPFQAAFVRSDRSKDLALLRLEGDFSEALKHCRRIQIVPRSYVPRVLTEVWALGSPFAMRHGASKGIISGTGRKVCLRLRYGNPAIPTPSKVVLTGMIQTDAAVNPGNSGGGLFLASGVLVGVVNSGRSFANSIGYALPPSMIHDFLKNI